MAEMRNFEAEASAWVGKHLPFHNANPQEQPQETHVTRISDAKAAIDRAAQQLASIGSNQLAEAIADAGIGKTFTPGDVGLVLAVIRAIEHGPGLATTPAVTFSGKSPFDLPRNDRMTEDPALVTCNDVR